MRRAAAGSNLKSLAFQSHVTSIFIHSHFVTRFVYDWNAMPPKQKPKHLQARVTFLDQAAKLLANQQFTSKDSTFQDENTTRHTGLPLYLASQLRVVAKRSQLQVGREVKRGICKTCATPLLPGKTSLAERENRSKDGKKPWADVDTVTCLNCGTKKRFPVGATRQKRKSQRIRDSVATSLPNEDSKNAALNAKSGGQKG